MKKYVVGIIIGAVLTFSGQAMADTVSKIGKKIDAEYTVVVDGKELTVKAVAVDGVSTTPNRALADAVGYNVDFKDNTIYFEKKEVVKTVLDIEEIPQNITEPTPEPEHYFTLENIDEAIKGQEGSVRIAEMWISDAEKNGYGETETEKLREGLRKAQTELDRFLRIKAELEAQQ